MRKPAPKFLSVTIVTLKGLVRVPLDFQMCSIMEIRSLAPSFRVAFDVIFAVVSRSSFGVKQCIF